MDIKTVIDFINRERGSVIPSNYYSLIDKWADWWRGFHQPFHEFTELQGDIRVRRKLYTLKMGKKVCEDWAALLLNEQTEISTDHEASNHFLTGVDGAGGLLEGFWEGANGLIEKAFSTGTGAIVVKLANMMAKGDVILKDADASIYFDYISAEHIIPLTVRQGKIIEVAFVSEVMEKGKPYIYIESHELESGGYVITNRYFSISTEATLKEEPLPEGMVGRIVTGSGNPMFGIIYPNIVNSEKDNNGLGMSVFANALDCLVGVDLAFNNFCRDFKLGGKKVFYSESLVRMDENGKKITPDDVMQQLFSVLGDLPLREDGRNSLMTEYNPTLRVQENKDGLQAQLDYLSFKCGFGTKHYQFNAGQIVTATQYTGDKQELVQNASKHMIVIERALKQVVRACLWAGAEVLGLPVNPEANITINFEDGFLIDTETERMRDLQEIRDGLLLPYEYRMKWRGESEEEAKAAIGETLTNDQIMGF